MIESRLSRRYAKAIFDLAREEHKEEAFASEIDRFVDAYNGSELHTVLNNPTLGLEKRKSLVLRIANRLELATLTVRFLSFLIERDRLVYIPSIALHYRRLLDEAKKRVEARVVTPTPRGQEKKDNLGRVLKGICGKEVILTEEIRGDLIGGLLIELEGKVYDGTISTQLQSMKESIERG